MKLRNAIIALAGAGAVAITGAALAAGSRSVSQPTVSTAPTVAKVALPTIQQRHTKSDMMALADGISYDDAARALGTLGHAEGHKLAVDLGLSQGGKIAVYAWPNPDGSRVVLVFQHDRLVHRQLDGGN